MFKSRSIIKKSNHIKIFIAHIDFKSMNVLGLKIEDRKMPPHADFLEKFSKDNTKLDISLIHFKTHISKNNTNKWGQETINME